MIDLAISFIISNYNFKLLGQILVPSPLVVGVNSVLSLAQSISYKYGIKSSEVRVTWPS